MKVHELEYTRTTAKKKAKLNYQTQQISERKKTCLKPKLRPLLQLLLLHILPASEASQQQMAPNFNTAHTFLRSVCCVLVVVCRNTAKSGTFFSLSQTLYTVQVYVQYSRGTTLHYITTPWYHYLCTFPVV